MWETARKTSFAEAVNLSCEISRMVARTVVCIGTAGQSASSHATWKYLMEIQNYHLTLSLERNPMWTSHQLQRSKLTQCPVYAYVEYARNSARHLIACRPQYSHPFLGAYQRLRTVRVCNADVITHMWQRGLAAGWLIKSDIFNVCCTVIGTNKENTEISKEWTPDYCEVHFKSVGS